MTRDSPLPSPHTNFCSFYDMKALDLHGTRRIPSYALRTRFPKISNRAANIMFPLTVHKSADAFRLNIDKGMKQPIYDIYTEFDDSLLGGVMDPDWVSQTLRAFPRISYIFGLAALLGREAPRTSRGKDASEILIICKYCNFYVTSMGALLNCRQ